MTELFENTRSLYHFQVPREELKNYIEFYWETSFESTQQILNGQPFTIKLFKSWTPTFWFNLGPAYNLLINGTTVHSIKSNSAVALTRATTVERINHPADHLFTVKFHPGALQHLMGVDQTKLGAAAYELHEFIPPILIEKIKRAENFQQRILLVETFLLQKLAHQKSADHYAHLVMQTIGFYQEHEMKFNVAQLASKAFTSSKTITRYFERVIGITPKQYLEMIKMRTALPSFLSNRKGFDPTAFGYYDKSHFYRSVVRFTGERIVDCT